MRDDLDDPVDLPGQVRRVVSLVPSLTEAIAATRPELLVGATDWCTHPQGLAVTRVRGTKNPDLNAIARLAPDLVVANREENRKLDVQRLRDRGIAVWVTRIDTVDDALTSLRRLFTEALATPAVDWLDDADAVWSAAPRLPALDVALPIWRRPWMWVGRDTYIDDVLRRLGLRNVVTAPRYPRLDLAEVLALNPALVLLPDEPYAFSPDDGPDALGRTRSVLVPGRALSWYGPAMVGARAELEHRIQGALTVPA
jgi:ABC-type Fe3+-hydroxamate transport system substrate-binding protein